jgi:hypothetical protein
LRLPDGGDHKEETHKRENVEVVPTSEAKSQALRICQVVRTSLTGQGLHVRAGRAFHRSVRAGDLWLAPGTSARFAEFYQSDRADVLAFDYEFGGQARQNKPKEIQL